MCRLMADTNVGAEHSMRRLVFNQLMLASNADGQRDGSGVSDGVAVTKSAYPFVQMGTRWIHYLDNTNIWMGHTRAASRHTEISPFASHPFSFTLANGSQLIAAHNGFINGMPEPLAREPRVDSYQAFKLLVDLLNEGNELTPDTINTWTGDFGLDSEWAFMLMLNGALTIVRGNRSMYYMTAGNGYLFNTSDVPLMHVKEWLNGFYPSQKIGRIYEIKAFHMLTLTPGKDELIFRPITPQAQTPVYTNMEYAWRDGKETLTKV